MAKLWMAGSEVSVASTAVSGLLFFAAISLAACGTSDTADASSPWESKECEFLDVGFVDELFGTEFRIASERPFSGSEPALGGFAGGDTSGRNCVLEPREVVDLGWGTERVPDAGLIELSVSVHTGTSAEVLEGVAFRRPNSLFVTGADGVVRELALFGASSLGASPRSQPEIPSDRVSALTELLAGAGDTRTSPNADTQVASLTCNADVLERAWNIGYDGVFPGEAGPYEVANPTCSAGVAIAEVGQSDDSGSSNPDFGVAVWLETESGWQPVTRFRTPFCDTIAAELRERGVLNDKAEVIASMFTDQGECL